MTAGLSIGEVAQHSGLSPSAIRYYEREGIVPEPDRVGGQRRYSTSVLALLQIVTLARQAGFTVREVRAVVEGIADRRSSHDTGEFVEAKLHEVRAQQLRLTTTEQRLTHVAGPCRCRSIEECASRLESTME